MNGDLPDVIAAARQDLQQKAIKDQLKEITSDLNAKPERFFDVLDQQRVMAIFLAMSPPAVSTAPSAIRGELENLRDTVRRETPELETSKVFHLAGYLAARKMSSQGDAEEMPRHWKRVTGHSYATMFTGENDFLMPCTRITLTGQADKVLLDFTADPDDLAWLSVGFAEMLVVCFEKILSLRLIDNVRIPDKEHLVNKVRRLRNALVNLDTLVEQLRLDTADESSLRSRAGTSKGKSRKTQDGKIKGG